MTGNIKVVFLMLLCFVVQCKTTPAKKPSYIVVLCDMSETVGSQKKALFDNIRRLPFCFESDSEIYFLPISENAEQKPLNNDKPISLRSFTDAEIDQEEAQAKAVRDDIENIIGELELFSNKEKKWTCILTAIENAFEKLEEKSKSDSDLFEYRLIIFSDMKESCLSSPIDKNGTHVEMGPEVESLNGNLQALENAGILMDQYNNPKIDFAKNKVIVDVITTTPGISAPKSKKITEIWTGVFKKMNYDSAIVMKSSFPFSEVE